MRKKMQESILEEARLYNSMLNDKLRANMLQRLTGKMLMYQDVTKKLVSLMYTDTSLISAIIFEDRTVEII